jgi:hypothetical protein
MRKPFNFSNLVHCCFVLLFQFFPLPIALFSFHFALFPFRLASEICSVALKGNNKSKTKPSDSLLSENNFASVSPIFAST